jgi:hypothetical protein
MYVDYKSKCLYRQSMTTEDGHDVLSCVHALSWLLQGGTTPITTRTRITIITNYHDTMQPNVITANIELWRETGWIMMEEMFDEKMHYDFLSREEVEIYCLNILELFFTGKCQKPIRNPSPSETPKPKIKKKLRPAKSSDDPDTPPVNEGPESFPDLILQKSSSMPDFDWI